MLRIPQGLPLRSGSFRFLLAAECLRCCEPSSVSLEGELVAKGLQTVLSSHLTLQIAFTSCAGCSSEHTAAVAFPFLLCIVFFLLSQDQRTWDLWGWASARHRMFGRLCRRHPSGEGWDVLVVPCSVPLPSKVTFLL